MTLNPDYDADPCDLMIQKRDLITARQIHLMKGDMPCCTAH